MQRSSNKCLYLAMQLLWTASWVSASSLLPDSSGLVVLLLTADCHWPPTSSVWWRAWRPVTVFSGNWATAEWCKTAAFHNKVLSQQWSADMMRFWLLCCLTFNCPPEKKKVVIHFGCMENRKDLIEGQPNVWNMQTSSKMKLTLTSSCSYHNINLCPLIL